MAKRTRKSADSIAQAASQIRQVMALFDTYGKSREELLDLAFEYDVEINEYQSDLGLSAELSDAAESRIRTYIEDAAKALGVSFEVAQERVNKALGY